MLRSMGLPVRRRAWPWLARVFKGCAAGARLRGRRERGSSRARLAHSADIEQTGMPRANDRTRGWRASAAVGAPPPSPPRPPGLGDGRPRNWRSGSLYEVSLCFGTVHLQRRRGALTTTATSGRRPIRPPGRARATPGGDARGSILTERHHGDGRPKRRRRAPAARRPRAGARPFSARLQHNGARRRRQGPAADALAPHRAARGDAGPADRSARPYRAAGGDAGPTDRDAVPTASSRPRRARPTSRRRTTSSHGNRSGSRRSSRGTSVDGGRAAPSTRRLVLSML